VIAKADAIMNGEHVGFFLPLSTPKHWLGAEREQVADDR
jgi:hypothetical protein